MYEYVLDPKPEGDEEPEEVFESVVSEYDSRVEDLHLKKEMKKKREREVKRKTKRGMKRKGGQLTMSKTKIWWYIIDAKDFYDSGNCMYSLSNPVYMLKSALFFKGDLEAAEVSVYELEVEFTPTILEKLLNKEFQHCNFSNYREAKRIFHKKIGVKEG